MLWKMARQTLVAAAVVGLLAGGWQLVAGPGAPAGAGYAHGERMHHDDD